MYGSRSRLLAIVTLLAGIVIAACQTSPSVPAPKAVTAPIKIKIAYPSPSGGFAAAWVAKEAGLYEKNGLDVEMAFIASGSTIIPALLNGELAFAVGGAGGALSAASSGADTVIVATFSERPSWKVMVNRSINKPQDLKGKRIGVNKLGDATHAVTLQVLDKVGLAPTDVTILQVGGAAERSAAIANNAIDATIVALPGNVAIERQGFKELLDLGRDLGIRTSGAGLYTTKTFVKKNPDIVERAVRAIAEAGAVLKMDSALSKRAIAKYMQFDDQDALEATYAFYSDSQLKVPLTSEDLINQAIKDQAKEDPRVGQLKASDVVDNSFVRKVESSGLIEKLYQK